MMNRLFSTYITPKKQPAGWVVWLPHLIVCMLLLAALPVRAAPPRSVLVLSIAEAGKQQDSLRPHVGELAQRAGARVVDVAGLSTSTRACDEPTCLGTLAEQHRVDLVLAARIERRSHHERIIDMWVYGAQIGDSRVQNVCCRHRPRHSSGGHFPGHGTKTAFELPIRRASAKRCGLRLVILAGLVWAER